MNMNLLNLRSKMREVLWLILIFQLIGSIYGYYWYREQLSQTVWYNWLFTWDCPFYATLFSAWLLSYLRNYSLHRSSLFTTLTWTGLIKYGLWTVIIVQDSYFQGSPISIDSLGLQISHVILLIEGFILLKTTKFRYIMVAMCWLILNDYMDYVVGTYPWILPQQVYLAKWLAISLTVLLSVSMLYLFAKEKISNFSPVNSQNRVQDSFGK